MTQPNPVADAKSKLQEVEDKLKELEANLKTDVAAEVSSLVADAKVAKDKLFTYLQQLEQKLK